MEIKNKMIILYRLRKNILQSQKQNRIKIILQIFQIYCWHVCNVLA
jgi:hypothetical protein